MKDAQLTQHRQHLAACRNVLLAHIALCHDCTQTLDGSQLIAINCEPGIVCFSEWLQAQWLLDNTAHTIQSMQRLKAMTDRCCGD